MNPPIRAVVFDAYGTLISTGTGSLEAAQKILARNGRLDIPADLFYAQWKRLHRAHIDGLDAFVKEEEIFRMDLRRLYGEYGFTRDAEEDVGLMLDTLGKRSLFPETGEVLRGLSKGFRLAIGSTTDTAPLLADLARGALDISPVYTSESLGVYKPRPAFYEKILDSLGLSPGAVLFVGDSLLDDVAGPQQAGMKACWVNRKGAEASQGVSPDLRGLQTIIG